MKVYSIPTELPAPQVDYTHYDPAKVEADPVNPVDMDGELKIEHTVDGEIKVSTEWPDSNGRTGVLYHEHSATDPDPDYAAVMRENGE